MLSHVQMLAGKIGPRGTGTPGEAAAADYVAQCLSAFGLTSASWTFRAVASQNAFPLAICLMALVAVAMYPWGGLWGRWIAALLASSTAPLLWQTIRTSTNPLRFLLPQVTSRNVLARIEPQSELRSRIVILAHLDTNRCRLVWQATTAQSLEPLTYLTLGILASLGVIYLIGALDLVLSIGIFGTQQLWYVSFIPAAYVLGMVFTLWRDDRVPFSCGAHDNAASVAVALEIGSRVAIQPLKHTQLWLVFTGAEETDHRGIYALLQRHHNELQSATFIGLEGLGSGDLVYLTRQGLCAHYWPDTELLALAEDVAARQPELQARPAEMLMEDEVGTLRRLGYRAICIAGYDPATGTLPHWHRPTDTAETVSTQFMGRAVTFLMAMLEEVDK
jgi:hypothetical protein